MASNDKYVSSHETRESGKEDINTKGFLLGAIIGGVVGAATALIFAPKSGKELREEIYETAGTVTGKTDGWKELAVNKGTQAASIAKEKTDKVRHLVIEKTNNITTSTKDKVTQVKDEGLSENESALVDKSVEVANKVEGIAQEVKENSGK